MAIFLNIVGVSTPYHFKSTDRITNDTKYTTNILKTGILYYDKQILRVNKSHTVIKPLYFKSNAFRTVC